MLRTIEVFELDRRRRYTMVLAASCGRMRVPGLRFDPRPRQLDDV
jgi:hypothetical protein